ncbi:MAG: T9SS type A sorting domain-containing protein [Bacteroidota bacterium]
MIVLLRVYDLLGREVAVLQNGPMNPGTYNIEFHGHDVSSGVYMVRLEAGAFVESRKVVLVK